MNARPSPLPGARPTRVPHASCGACAPARGFSLIVAMLMLAVIGLASAAIMRNATSGDQVANNNRLQAQASQYAQLALRLCERQVAQPAGARTVALLPAATPAAWTLQRSWTQSGTGSAHRLTAAEIGSATLPRLAPQCLMEATATPSLVLVTARGFSADFVADGATGATRSGSTVWLQATLFAGAAAAASGADSSASAVATDGAPSARRRTWQQLLTPPF